MRTAALAAMRRIVSSIMASPTLLPVRGRGPDAGPPTAAWLNGALLDAPDRDHQDRLAPGVGRGQVASVRDDAQVHRDPLVGGGAQVHAVRLDAARPEG